MSTLVFTEKDEVHRDAEGRTHRDNDLPAAITPDGDQYWFCHGIPFREDPTKPHVVYEDGEQEWLEKDGESHRDGDLPALIYADGTKNGTSMEYSFVKIRLFHMLNTRMGSKHGATRMATLIATTIFRLLLKLMMGRGAGTSTEYRFAKIHPNPIPSSPMGNKSGMTRTKHYIAKTISRLSLKPTEQKPGSVMEYPSVMIRVFHMLNTRMVNRNGRMWMAKAIVTMISRLSLKPTEQ